MRASGLIRCGKKVLLLCKGEMSVAVDVVQSFQYAPLCLLLMLVVLKRS